MRFATFNVSLFRAVAGALIDDLATPSNSQAQAVSEIIQRVQPDVLLLNEFDYSGSGDKQYSSPAIELFQKNYLSVSQNGAPPIEFPYTFVAPSNTGITSGRDLDKDSFIGGPGDAFGFGLFPGQYGMVVFSKHPIDYPRVRTFQNFLWKDMPGALLPKNRDGTDYFNYGDRKIFRLSSKSHWDVPIKIGKQTVHLLASHPTPPTFDGPEKRNALRNHDEIRFWADYVDPTKAGYIYDDLGNYGGIDLGELFVILGDQNADPFGEDNLPGAAQQLLEHSLTNSEMTPSSKGGPEQAALLASTSWDYQGDPAFATVSFLEDSPDYISRRTGILRVDYVLPSIDFAITDAGVFWPSKDEPFFELVGGFPYRSSDHRLVWIDVEMPKD